MKNQLQTFSFSPPRNFFEEKKWTIAVTSFETTNSVFKITDKNNSFSISVPGLWRFPNYLGGGYIGKLKNLLKLRSQNHIELHVKAVRKRSKKIFRDKEYKLSAFDTSKKETLQVLKSVKYHDLEDLVYRM